MIQVNTADFRASMSTYFDKAYNGEQVMITRKNQMFMLTPVNHDELAITPELEAKIEKSRKEIAEGKGIRFDSQEKMNEWLNSL